MCSGEADLSESRAHSRGRLVTWAAAVPAVVAAVIAVLGPGLLATAPLRIALLPRIALSGPAGIVATGAAAVLGGVVGLPFQVWQAFVIAVFAAAVLVPMRRILPVPVSGLQQPSNRLLILAWSLGAVLVAAIAFAGVPSPDRISQTYDNVFHLSAVAAILDGFSASPLTLRSLIETGADGLAYYPAAWHQLVVGAVQLSGSSVPVAFNAVWLVTSTLCWLPGVAWLSQVILPGWTRAAAIVALPLGAAFGAFPFALLAWGTIYPTGLAHALLPAAVAVVVLAMRAVAGRQPRAGSLLLLAAVLAVASLGLAHPRVLPTWVLIGAPFVLGLLLRVFRQARRRGGRSARRALAWMLGLLTGSAVAVGTALAIAVLRFGLFDEPVEERLNGPQARAVQAIFEGIAQMVGQQAMTGWGAAVTAVAPLLATVVLVGAVVAIRLGPTRWIVVGWLVLAALAVLAAGSDGVIAKMATGIWYKDRFRLAAAVPVLAVPLAALGTLVLADLLRRIRPALPRRPLAVSFAALVALSSAGGLLLTGSSAAVAHVFRLPAQDAGDAVVSARQIAFLESVDEIVPEGQRVLGDPWDGSALTQLLADREPVFPHVNGQWDDARLTLAWRLDTLGEDPEVCDALDALRVRYVLYDPHELAGGDPAGNHFPGPHAAVEAGLLTAAASDGTSILYRIDACGPLPATPH